MNIKNTISKKINLYLVIVCIIAALTGCSNIQDNKNKDEAIENTDIKSQEVVLTIKGDGLQSDITYTLSQLKNLQESTYEHIYSTINNWPIEKTYAARGIKVKNILENAGVLNTVQIVTFKSPDGYEVSFTRSQLIDTERYYYIKDEIGAVKESELVEPILAYEYKEASKDLSEVYEQELCFIIGQANPNEHTNPSFVVGVKEIIISNEKPVKWEMPTTFPLEGVIASKETVKLQHKSFGITKLHYTLDKTEPTEMSAIYNPSTYQPQLNKPIPITEDTTIKVLVVGFGKENSEIATFEFKVD